jgi:mannose-6-phosphate isomerase-like protein (cupin superfamily)
MQIINRDRIKPFITKDKSQIREFYHSQNVSLAEAVVDIGEITEFHFHKTSEEIYFILDGEGLIDIEGEEKKVSKDQAIIIPPKKRHRISNVGNSQLRFLCICSPAYSDKDTILVKKRKSIPEDPFC